MRESLSDQTMQAFLVRAEEAADAYVRSDMQRYVELTPHAESFTLLPPYGGPAGRHTNRDAELRQSPDFIRDGSARLEQVEVHAWGDTLVVAMIERQHGRLDGRPDQDLSLRVTHVYRRERDIWRLVHRHADPLVETMTLDELLALMGP